METPGLSLAPALLMVECHGAARPNRRHGVFAQQVAKGVSRRAAYKTAGYTAKSDAAADANASRLISDDKVQARIAELQAAVSDRTVAATGVTKAWVIDNLIKHVEHVVPAQAKGERVYKGSAASRGWSCSEHFHRAQGCP